MAFADVFTEQFAKQLGSATREFTVAIQPESACALSGNLQKFLSTKEQADATSTLNDLRELNNRFAGKSSLRALASIELSEELWLVSELAWDWVQQYANRRLRKHNPKDGLSPLRTFDRLIYEFGNNVLVPYCSEPYISCFLRWTLFNRFAWLLYTSLLEKYAPLRRKGAKGVIRPDVVAALRADKHVLDRTQLQETLGGIFTYLKWNSDFVPEFVGRLRSSVEAAIASQTEMRVQFSNLAREIREIRCFVGGSKPGSIAIEIGGQTIGVKWIAVDGLCELHIGESEAEMLKSIRALTESNGTSRMEGICKVLLRYDGLIGDCFRSDITIDNHDTRAAEWYSINLAVLRRLHARLFASFEKIDFSRFREDEVISPEDEDRVLAVAMFDLDFEMTDNPAVLNGAIGCDIVNDKDRGMRLGSLRLSKLEPALRQFKCVIESGKGSEQKVSRPGSNYPFFILSKHSPDPEIGRTLLKKLLRHFEISIREFRSAVRSPNPSCALANIAK